MNTVLILIAFLWVGRIFVNTVSFVHLWYVKEYRLDRMFIHFKTSQGKRLYFLPFRRPPVTLKSVSLILGSTIVLWVLFAALPTSIYVRLFLLDVFSFPATLLLVLLSNAPTFTYHEIQIARAVRELRHHKPMIVIGITGSFGKTSTKEYLATILSTKFNVLKTEASKNSPIGIAETILSSLRPDHEVFIVEMGAYKRGEIAQMAAMVRPEIGIITAINAQHQDLFGTMDNTMKAKYELVQDLVGKGIAILNADNEFIVKMAQWAKRSKKTLWSFSVDNKKILEASKNFLASEISSDLKGLFFTISDGISREKIHARVLGEHQASNVIAAVAGAIATGMSMKEAARAASFITPFTKTLSLIPGINGSNYIDDTFNNNPDGAKAALDVLAKAKGKKILVFQPMIELGTYTDSAHIEVGQYAAKICDEIVLTNNNFFDYFQKGVHLVNPQQTVHVFSSTKAASFIESKLKKDDTVLFKGKEADTVLKKLSNV